MKRKIVIGISGNARVGKNLFADLLQERLLELFEIKVGMASFAAGLRQELDPIFRKEFNISAWTTIPKEKELIRPMLIAYAYAKRQKTKGRYFINLIKPSVQSLLEKNNIVCITDTRFKEFEYDETDYIKENGFLVHISKFSISPLTGRQVFVDPTGFEEVKNNETLKKEADYLIEWEHQKDNNYSNLSAHIDDFITFLSKKELF